MKTKLLLLAAISFVLVSCSSITREPTADNSGHYCKGPYKTRFLSNSGHADYYDGDEKNVPCRE